MKARKGFGTILLVMAVFGFFSVQTAPLADDGSKIEELEKRVAALEAALAKALADGTIQDTAELQRRIDLLTQEIERMKLGPAAGSGELRSMYGLGPAASKVYGVEEGVSIGGYGETLLQDFDARDDSGERTGDNTEYDFLRAVLYFGYKFNDRIVFNSEIEFEHSSTGEEGEVSVEFATIDFLLHESANARAGLVLVPVGFINEMHEPPTYLGARRPDVETRVLPTTWRENGVGIFGDAGPFSYRAYIVNGFDASGFSASSGLRGGRQDGSEASARDMGFVVRADHNGIPGLLAGASFYSGESGQGAETAAGEEIGGKVAIVEVHAEYRFRGAQFRALWSRVDVDDAEEINEAILGLDPSMIPADAFAGVGERITGWYGQAGYDILARAAERTRQSVIPFVRYERYDTQDEVPDGFKSDGSNDVSVVTYGVSYKPIEQVSIKVDYQNYDRGDGSGTDQFNAALGYLF